MQLLDEITDGHVVQIPETGGNRNGPGNALLHANTGPTLAACRSQRVHTSSTVWSFTTQDPSLHFSNKLLFPSNKFSFVDRSSFLHSVVVMLL